MSANTSVAQAYDHIVTLAAVPGAEMTIKIKKGATLGKVLAHAVTIAGCNKVIKKAAANNFKNVSFSVNGRGVGADYIFQSNTTVTITEGYQGNKRRGLLARAWGFLANTLVGKGD